MASSMFADRNAILAAPLAFRQPRKGQCNVSTYCRFPRSSPSILTRATYGVTSTSKPPSSSSRVMPPPAAPRGSSTRPSTPSPPASRAAAVPASPALSTASAASSRKPTTTRKSSSDRRAEIAAHALCEKVEPARVLCVRCRTWVPLSEKTPYSTRPWYAHIKACTTGGSPAK
jgi:hypothetical protein